MRWSSLILCLWPGLGPLWLRGSPGGLLTAAAFGGLLNFVIMTTFIWPRLAGDELPPWLVPGAGWMLVLWLWVGGVFQSRRMLAAWATPPIDDRSETLFRQAQGEYLKGQWVAAERLLGELIGKRPADAEARLLLATTLRRMKRTEDALRELTTLAELPTAYRWEREIADERTRLKTPTAESKSIESKLTETVKAELTKPVMMKPATKTEFETGPSRSASKTKVPAQESDANSEPDEEVQIIAYERVERERQRRKAA